jgi:alkyl hydroperoxide reductase subunit D
MDIPDYAKDLKVNLEVVLNQAELTEQQTWGTALAAAMACRNEELTRSILTEAQTRLTPEALNAAKSAAAIMGMNNIYFRFSSQIPSRLRMRAMLTHGVDLVDFELWCVAVSTINGCGECVAAHQKKLLDKGIKEETIMAAVRIAAVIHGLAVVVT